MESLWLLKGSYEAAGWRDLERDSKAGAVDLVMFDRLAWAMVRSEVAPSTYEGMVAERPADGLYIDPNGYPLFVVGGAQVGSAREVIAALGPEAEELLARLGDPDVTLERLGRVF